VPRAQLVLSLLDRVHQDGALCLVRSVENPVMCHCGQFVINHSIGLMIALLQDDEPCKLALGESVEIISDHQTIRGTVNVISRTDKARNLIRMHIHDANHTEDERY